MSLLDMMDTTATDEMSVEELRFRLLDYFRNGRINIGLKGVVLGFAAACKRNGPSVKQLELARGLVRECRYLDGTEPENVIDWDDVDESPARESREQMWTEFR